LWVKYNGRDIWAKITVNSTKHLDKIDDILRESIKYNIDYDYYTNLADWIKNTWKLKEYADIRDEADTERFFYGLLDYLEINHYSSEEEYKKALNNYNISKEKLEIKLNQLEQVKNKLEEYWIKLKNIQKNENELLVAKTEYTTINQELIVLSWNKEIKELEYQTYSESKPEIENEKKYNKIVNWYIASKNYIRTIKIAKWEEWYTYIEKNKNNYNDFPFTSYIKINRTKLNTWEINVYPALVWIEYKLWDNIVYSTERLEAQNYEQIQEIEKYLQQKVIERQDLNKNISLTDIETIYWKIQLISNNGWYWDGYDENYKWINNITLNADIEYLAWILFKYKLENDQNFKRWYENEVQRQKILSPELDIDEIKRAVKDWTIKATRDYLMQYIDLAESLSNLTLNDISNWLNWIWNTIKQPEKIVSFISDEFYDLKETFNTALDKLIWLWTYEKTYWWTYVWTTLW
jgi:hypothetical protein